MRRFGHLDVDSNALLARWTQWQSDCREERVQAVKVADQRPALFVQNEVLIGASERDLIEECRRLGGEVVESASIPMPTVPSREIDPRRMAAAATMALPTVIRFHEPLTGQAPERILLERAARTSGEGSNVAASDDAAASLAAFAVRHAEAGRDISLNFLGQPDALRLRAPFEGGGSDPSSLPEFADPFRVIGAWQLVESVRAVRPVPSVSIAIIDNGFWVDAQGIPLVATAFGETASDSGLVLLARSVVPEGPVNVPNHIPAGDGSVPRWHGNSAASVAAAVVGNSLGAAGAGGSIAQLMLFRTRYRLLEVLRALQWSVALSADIVNMSFTISDGFWEVFDQLSAACQLARDNGVILVASAGNDGQRLPDLDLRPATRTPGVITVGAIDTDLTARDDSNYGDSVDIWAPGTNLTVIPHGDWQGGAMPFYSGTSAAAPFVAGIAALMRAVNPTLNTDQLGLILQQTGWNGSDGRLTAGVDAHAALLKVLDGKLPPDLAQPNHSRATAKTLSRDPTTGFLRPLLLGPATHNRDRSNYWSFDLDDVSVVDIRLDWYTHLGGLRFDVEADNPEDHETSQIGNPVMLSVGRLKRIATLSPGKYYVRISGDAITAYELSVRPKPFKILADAFEPNDSFDTAKPMLFVEMNRAFVERDAAGPGDFDLTLHQHFSLLAGQFVVNTDYFRLLVPANSGDIRSHVVISGCDFPVQATLFDASRTMIDSRAGTQISIDPPAGATSYLKIAGSKATRYNLQVARYVDPSILPPDIALAEVLPPWWKMKFDFKLTHEVKYFVLDLERDHDPAISLDANGRDLTLEILDTRGSVLRVGSSSHRKGVSVATDDLEPGRYFLKITATKTGHADTSRISFIPPVRW